MLHLNNLGFKFFPLNLVIAQQQPILLNGLLRLLSLVLPNIAAYIVAPDSVDDSNAVCSDRPN